MLLDPQARELGIVATLLLDEALSVLAPDEHLELDAGGRPANLPRPRWLRRVRLGPGCGIAFEVLDAYSL